MSYLGPGLLALGSLLFLISSETKAWMAWIFAALAAFLAAANFATGRSGEGLLLSIAVALDLVTIWRARNRKAVRA